MRPFRTVKNEIWKAAALSLAHDVIAADRSGAILQLDMPDHVWSTGSPQLEMRPWCAPEICEQACRHLTVSPILYAVV